LPLLLASTACIRNMPYRTANPVLHETPKPYCDAGNAPYTLSFVEFDDMGELWQPTEGPTELDRVLQEIQRQRDKAPIVLLFVHGWKNNASDQSGNVWGFRCELGRIANEYGKYGRPVIGVFLGWRGDVTSVDFFKNFTFWNRITAAARIPGAHMTDVILRVMRLVKGADGKRNATLIAVGHSFGGLVLERAVTQALVERIDDFDGTGDGFYFPADLVVLLNEAGPAIQAKQLLDLLSRRNATFNNGAVNQPLLLSMTSKGDTATHFAFPGGQALSLFKVDLRKYFQTDPEKPGADEFGVTDQRSYYLLTAANTGALQSHVVGLPNDPDVQAAINLGNKPYTTANLPNSGDFLVVPKAKAKNTTPYWIMQIPVAFVPDHTTIFRPEFDQLIKAFLKQRPEMSPRAPGAPVPATPKLRLKL
jgi:hypothetical protein